MTILTTLNAVTFSAAAISNATAVGVDLKGNLSAAQIAANELLNTLTVIKTLLAGNDANLPALNAIQSFYGWANFGDAINSGLLAAPL